MNHIDKTYTELQENIDNEQNQKLTQNKSCPYWTGLIELQ